MKFAHAGISLIAMLTLAPASAKAQFTVYMNFAEYLAAVSTPGIDTFNDLNVTDFSALSLERRVTNGSTAFEYLVGAIDGTYIVGTDTDEWLSTNDAENALTFDVSASGVTGIGGYFFGTGLEGNFLPGAGVQLTATNSAGATVVTVLPTTTTTFRGFVSLNGNVSSLMALAIQNGDVVFPTVNDLVLGRAPAVVPEPSTFAMMVAGALGLAAASRRRRTA